MPQPRHRIFVPLCWAHFDDELTNAMWTSAATTLGCEVAAIRAVAETEARGEPWDFMGRPRILFERHKFSHHTGHVHDAAHPDISNRARGGYGREAAQYDRLYRAAQLDEPAALKSASYGLFQILGENHVEAGHATVEAFVDAMLGTRGDHLRAFVAFVASSRAMKRAIQQKQWATFARLYNGPRYAENSYDTKMAEAYARLTR